jgi:hypothetical protein
MRKKGTGAFFDGKVPHGLTRNEILRMMAEELSKAEREQKGPGGKNETDATGATKTEPDGAEGSSDRRGKLPQGVRNANRTEASQKQKGNHKDVGRRRNSTTKWVSIAHEDHQFKRRVVRNAPIDGSIQHAYTIMDAQR